MIPKPILVSILVGLVGIYYYYVSSIITYVTSEVNNVRLNKLSQSAYSPQLTNSFKKGSPKLSSNSYVDNSAYPKNRTQIGGENATMVMLVRNRELSGALDSMRSLEDRFNRDFRYPWVFLNDEPFDEEFIEKTSLMASGKTFYELIPAEDWQPPVFIDRIKLDESIQKAIDDDIIYGFSKSYRNMCHFNSGYFYKQKRLLDYEWYFRVEPDVEYMCDFQYDPFKLMRENNKKYGFVIAIHEYENTVPTLWPTVEKFMEQYPELIHPNSAIDFLTTNETNLSGGLDINKSNSSYNLCHFWSNFEIGNLDFFRGPAYEEFFRFLDRAGGFYYERWGDAPVHTIGVSLLMDKNEIHHFEDIGYFHNPYLACPSAYDVLAAKRCICKTRNIEDKFINKIIDTSEFSCLSRWWRYGSGKKFLNDIDYSIDH